MAVLSKPRPVGAYRDDAARSRLRDAQAALAALQIDAEGAKLACDAAWREYRDAQTAVEDIEARISDLADQYRRVHPMGRDEIQRRVDECQQPLRQARAPLMALAQAEEAAAERIKEAEQRIDFQRSRIREAAEAVIRAEAPQVAKVMVPALRQAFDTIRTVGPDLLWLIENGMLPHDAIDALGDGPRRMLAPMQSWSQFDQAYRASPWRGVAALLEADPDAPLPSVPPPLL